MTSNSFASDGMISKQTWLPALNISGKRIMFLRLTWLPAINMLGKKKLSSHTRFSFQELLQHTINFSILTKNMGVYLFFLEVFMIICCLIGMRNLLLMLPLPATDSKPRRTKWSSPHVLRTLRYCIEASPWIICSCEQKQ